MRKKSGGGGVLCFEEEKHAKLEKLTRGASTEEILRLALARLLSDTSEDVHREGLRDTPRRIQEAWRERLAGYDVRVEALITTFESEADEMVTVRDIDFHSTCEHHLLPFMGTAHVGYIPDGKILGLSKFARLVLCFSRRLQVQERLTTQIRAAIDEHVEPKGAAVVIEAKHLCMACRGVHQANAITTTASLSGVFKDEHDTRAEFYRLIGK